MNMLPARGDFDYVSNSPVAHNEICRALDMVANPNNVTLSLWKDERLRGVIMYERFSRRSIFVHIVGFQPGWFNRKFLWLGFHYPLVQLNVGKIFGLVSASNDKSLKFFHKLGFMEETRIKDVYSDGADQVVLVMKKEDCRWLKLRV